MFDLWPFAVTVLGLRRGPKPITAVIKHAAHLTVDAQAQHGTHNGCAVS